MNRATKIVIIFIFTYFSLMLLCTDFNIGVTTLTKDDLLLHINIVLKNFDIVDVMMVAIIYFFYYSIFFNGEKFTKKNIWISLISILISIVMVIGKNLQIKNSFPNLFNMVMLFEVVTTFLGSYFASYAILKKIISLDIFGGIRLKKKQKNKFKIIQKIVDAFNNHPFLFSFVVIIICRLPYMVIYYPAAVNGDTVDQLCQFFNLSGSWSKDMVRLSNPNVYLNSHHPVFSTLFLGGMVKFGDIIGSYRFGLFIYIFLQIMLSTSIFAFVIYYMKKNNISLWVRSLSLILISLIPQFSSYTICAIKDTPSALFTLLYVIFLIQIVRNYESVYSSKKYVMCFIITMLLVMLFRNNGIITIVLSYPFLFFLYRKYFKKILIIFLIPLVIYFSFNQIMYKCFDVSKGSVKEVLSVPFMQIARVVNKKGNNAFSKKDQDIINKILVYKKLGNIYNPDLSDDVKDLYRIKSTNKDLLYFFGVWFKYLFKYPNIYIESFINSTYQYFYPYETYENTNLYFDSRLTKYFPTIKPLKKFNGIKNCITGSLNILFNLPIIGLLFKVCFYDWFLIFSCFYCLYKKSYKYLIPLMALVAVLLVCLASPINGSMRYILPILFSFPAIIMIDYLVYKDCCDK